MDNFHIWYKKPKVYERTSKIEERTDSIRTTTLIIEDKLRDSELKIPITPYIHPRGIQELALQKNKNTMVVAVILITALKTREQENTLELSQESIALMSNLNLKATNTALLELIDCGYLVKLGKQKYRLSPKLCWFGNQVDWAIALKELNSSIL